MKSIVTAIVAYIDERLAILDDRIKTMPLGRDRDFQIDRRNEVLAIATRLAVLTTLTKGESPMTDHDEIRFAKTGEHHERTLPDGRVQRLVTRTSIVSGQTITRIFTATLDQWAALDKGALIQHALPHFSAGDREFLLTGMTDEEWDATFPEEDEAAAPEAVRAEGDDKPF